MSLPFENPPVPGTVSKVIRFTKAAVRHVINGLPTASDPERERRLALCQVCEHFDAGKCRKCGCRLANKAAWALESCPVGKW